MSERPKLLEESLMEMLARIIARRYQCKISQKHAFSLFKIESIAYLKEIKWLFLWMSMTNRYLIRFDDLELVKKNQTNLKRILRSAIENTRQRRKITFYFFNGRDQIFKSLHFFGA